MASFIHNTRTLPAATIFLFLLPFFRFFYDLNLRIPFIFLVCVKKIPQTTKHWLLIIFNKLLFAGVAIVYMLFDEYFCKSI
jgi:hypothetical protein